MSLVRLGWREPIDVFAPFAEEPWAVLLLSAAGGRWSYIARAPTATGMVWPDDSDHDFVRLRRMLAPPVAARPDGPPFQGGVIGLIAYEFGYRLEAAGATRVRSTGEFRSDASPWPDLALARFESLLAFDHQTKTVIAIGGAEAWLKAAPVAPGCWAPACVAAETAGEAYETAVAEVTAAIAAGEIFQANIARAWSGRLAAGATPFSVFERLRAASPAPYCAYWRLPDRALVSHSPERFLSVDGGQVETRPIKGTRPRGADERADRALAAELLASAKDRAENLMIVDLMRNDLARVCEPGSVRAPTLCALESFTSVHHLVSTVTGRLAAGIDAADLLAAAFPPGSITGAPKSQAMKVIARHERAPRGPWCGALFWAGFDGAFDSSVLIRSAGFTQNAAGWRFRFQAGAGIVADSVPAAERAETEVKASGLLQALKGRL